MLSHFSDNSTEDRGKSGLFVLSATVIFLSSLSAADSIGFVPYYVDGSTPHTEVALADLPELGREIAFVVPAPMPAVESVVPTPAPAQPERIIINEISLDLPVLNPSTRDIGELDEVLKDGPVRYVDSAKLGEQGNVLIFAHTSHLPVVRNKMYKAFNRVPELEAGDTIVVVGGGREFTYRVTDVRRADAEDEVIDLSPVLGTRLTLVTCDTLTSKSSRFILDAEFVSVR